MKTFRVFCTLKNIFVFTLIFFMLFSCKTPANDKKEEPPYLTENNGTVQPLVTFGGTPLKIPSIEELENKKIRSIVLKKIGLGTPKTLKEALSLIQNEGISLENKTYLIIIYKMMSILYPYEEISRSIPKSPEGDKYIKALDDVIEGAYPYHLGFEDFLELIIPPMLLVYDNILERYYADAAERLNRAKENNPKSVLVHYLEGKLNELMKNEAGAYAAYKTAWELDFSCYPAGIRYASLAAKQGDAQTALEIASLIEAQYGNKPEIQMLFAKGFMAKKDWDGAEPYIMEVLTSNPEEIEALLMKISVLIEKQEYMKANALLESYSAKNKTGKTYLLLRAKIYKDWNKNLITAAKYLTDAYKFYPNDFDVLLACAEICFDTGQKIAEKSADDFIKNILEKDPENVQALQFLVKGDITAKKWGDAVAGAVKLFNKSGTPENSSLLAEAYLGAGRNKEALSFARTLYTSEALPNNSLTAQYLEALYRMGEYAKLQAVITKRMPSAKPDLKAILYFYSAKLSKGNPENYLNALRSSLLANPRNEKALFSMYEWYFLNKDYRKASYYLNQVIALDPNNKENTKLAENLDRILAE